MCWLGVAMYALVIYHEFRWGLSKIGIGTAVYTFICIALLQTLDLLLRLTMMMCLWHATDVFFLVSCHLLYLSKTLLH